MYNLFNLSLFAMPETPVKFLNVNVFSIKGIYILSCKIVCNYKKFCLFWKVGQLKVLLKSVLDQWSHHKVAFDEINSCLMEARYSLSRFCLLTGSLEAVQVQVDNLQVRSELTPSLAFFLIREIFLKMNKFKHRAEVLVCLHCLHLIIFKIFKISFTCFICYIIKLACGYQILE